MASVQTKTQTQTHKWQRESRLSFAGKKGKFINFMSKVKEDERDTKVAHLGQKKITLKIESGVDLGHIVEHTGEGVHCGNFPEAQ